MENSIQVLRRVFPYLLVIVAFSGYVIADPFPQGSSVVNNSAVDSGTHLANGFSYPFRNGLMVNGSSTTIFWAGIFGNITGTIQLRGSSNKSLHTWGNTGNVRNQTIGVLTYGSIIFAYNSTALPDWANIQNTPYNNTELDTLFGSSLAITDGPGNLFVKNSNAVNVGGVSVTGPNQKTAASTTHFEGVFTTNPVKQTNGTVYKTMVLEDLTSNTLFATVARPIQANLFLWDNQTQANFQMLLWMDGRVEVSRSYDLYVQLT